MVLAQSKKQSSYSTYIALLHTIKWHIYTLVCIVVHVQGHIHVLHWFSYRNYFQKGGSANICTDACASHALHVADPGRFRGLSAIELRAKSYSKGVANVLFAHAQCGFAVAKACVWYQNSNL